MEEEQKIFNVHYGGWNHEDQASPRLPVTRERGYLPSRTDPRQAMIWANSRCPKEIVAVLRSSGGGWCGGPRSSNSSVGLQLIL